MMLPVQLTVNQKNAEAPTNKSDLEVIAYLKNNVAADEYVITDEQLFAVLTNRLIPPNLTETSFMRLKTNRLTETELILLTEQYQPQAIIFGREGRFTQNVPGYFEWVSERYQLQPLAYPGNILFIRKADEK